MTTPGAPSSVGFSLVSLSRPGCGSLVDDRFEAAVEATYLELAGRLASLSRFPVRIWNFVPGIAGAARGNLDRYMVFNAGRSAAYMRWRKADLEGWVPAASAVGSDGDTLRVVCLAADTAGTPIESTLQTPAYRYSSRYGPVPPCFSRATVVPVPGGSLLCVSGTASIRGEDSVLPGDLGGQLVVTIENLRHIWLRAREVAPSVPPLTDARIYMRRTRDAGFVVDELRSAFPTLRRFELVRAALCRRDLLVEIEAAAVPSAGLPAPGV